MMEITEVFNAKVSLDYNDCDICEFGHIGMFPKTTEEFDNYADAWQAGVDMATRHNGGEVTVIKFTRVTKKEITKGVK